MKINIFLISIFYFLFYFKFQIILRSDLVDTNVFLTSETQPFYQLQFCNLCTFQDTPKQVHKSARVHIKFCYLCLNNLEEHPCRTKFWP